MLSLISIKPLTPSSLISTGRNSFKLEGREIFYFLSVSGISMFGGFPGGSVVKNPPVNAGGTGLTPGPGRSRREGNGNPLQYSCLEIPMDRGAWSAIVHGALKSQIWLSNRTIHYVCSCCKEIYIKSESQL